MNRDVGSVLPFLPVADETGTREFIDLYERRFGVRLSPEDSCEILSGLMRFLYLTRFRQYDDDDQGNSSLDQQGGADDVAEPIFNP